MITLLLICLFRALRFKPKQKENKISEPISFDKDKAVSDLQNLIKIKTVSFKESEKEDDNEFTKLEKYLKTAFPLVYKTCTFEKVGTRGLLYKWSGKSSANPSVLMAHYDVVPAEEAMWAKPPFSGIIEDGTLWGRGTLDTKVTFNAILQAAEYGIANGFVPENDIYMAFAGDEEIVGPHAKKIVDLLKERGITPALVLDEGGAVVEKVFPGVSGRSAMVGIAEKGMINLKYTVKGQGGHSATPKGESPVVTLSKACMKVNNNPFPSVLTKPARDMFDIIARHSKSFGIRFIFANLWLFKGLLGKLALKMGGEMNALLRTTVAFTQMQGSMGMNVIPPEASILANIRIISGESCKSTVEYIKNVINDDRVELSMVTHQEPSRVSIGVDDPGFQKVGNAISQVWGSDVVVCPYLMLQCSDSRHYGLISDKVYRFSAMELTAEERGLIHGNDERIPIKSIHKSVEFYIRLVEQL